jgi:predicted ferric reductase
VTGTRHVSNATLVAPDESERSTFPGPLAIIFVFCVNLGIVLLFWWLASGAVPVKTLADRLNTIGRLTGLIGTYLILWQLLLLARLPWLERAFGMDRLMWLHRWNAYLAVGFIGAHAVTQTVGYQIDDGFSVLRQLWDFIDHYEGLLMAIVALVLMVGVTILSVTIVRSGMAYETWYFVHLYSYLAVALAFSHQLATGADFIQNAPFTAYWWMLYAVVFSSLAIWRVVLPLWRFARHGFRVERVEREATGAFSVYVGGRDLDRFHFEPGQFAIWRFLDARRWFEAHPFSLSATPNGEYLRLTVKRTGDFGAKISSLRKGTPVLVEGPFGRFTRRSCLRSKALLIAGGIGVTPIRALAEDLAEDGVAVTLLYRSSRDTEVAFRAELNDLAQTHGVRVEYLISDRHLRGRPGGQWLEPAHLRTLVPDIAEREVYVCGPVGMTEKLRWALGVLEVPAAQIHTEAFRF